MYIGLGGQVPVETRQGRRRCPEERRRQMPQVVLDDVRRRKWAAVFIA